MEISSPSFPLSHAVIPAKAGIQRERGRLARLCQNQDFQDYRIFRILPARASSIGRRSSIFRLSGFPIMEKSAIGQKRNPENPANPMNPDSDKTRRRPPHAALIHVQLGGIRDYGERRNPGESEIL